jgi:hypothetical protein
MKLVLALVGVVVTLGIIGAVVAFVGLDFTSQSARTEVHTAASVAMHSLSLNQEINESLGVPVKMGEISMQHEDSSFLGPHTVTLSIVLSGTKSTGKATVTVVKAARNKPWVFKNGSFFPANGRPIFVR